MALARAPDRDAWCPPLAVAQKRAINQRIRTAPATVDDTYDAAMPDRRRQPKTMNDETRAQVIMSLRRRGWTYAQIGKRVGLSANGTKYALMRVTNPGRYAEDFEEEVDHAPAGEEW